MGLRQPTDGSTGIGYFSLKKLQQKDKFSWDKCCHLMLCLHGALTTFDNKQVSQKISGPRLIYEGLGK